MTIATLRGLGSLVSLIIQYYFLYFLTIYYLLERALDIYGS